MEFWGYAPTVHTAAHALSWYFVNNPPVIAFEPPQSTPPRPWVQNSWDADLPAKATSARDLLERRDAGLYLAQRAAELNTTDPRLCDSDGLMLDPLRPGLPRKPPRTVTSQSKTRERDRDALIGTDSDPWVRWLTTSPDRCTPPLHTCPHSAPASRHGSRDCSTGSSGFQDHAMDLLAATQSRAFHLCEVDNIAVQYLSSSESVTHELEYCSTLVDSSDLRTHRNETRRGTSTRSSTRSRTRHLDQCGPNHRLSRGLRLLLPRT